MTLELSEELSSLATLPLEINFRSCRNGGLLSVTQIVPDLQTSHGAPHLVLHRGDLLAFLLKEARRLDLQLMACCTAAEIGFAALMSALCPGRSSLAMSSSVRMESIASCEILLLARKPLRNPLESVCIALGSD
jgi:hypothetical protein